MQPMYSGNEEIYTTGSFKINWATISQDPLYTAEGFSFAQSYY